MDPRLEEAFRRARKGDPRAFRRLADKVGRDLVTYLTLFLGGDVHAAHDVAQDVLLRAWDQLPALQDVHHFRRWCYRVGHCKAVSWIRRRAPRGRRFESLDHVGEDGISLTRRPHRTPPPRAGDEGLEGLRRALRRLPASYLGPVHLYYVQGLSTAETARLLGIRRQTVKMRLHRARAWLRRELEDASPSGTADPSDAQAACADVAKDTAGPGTPGSARRRSKRE